MEYNDFLISDVAMSCCQDKLDMPDRQHFAPSSSCDHDRPPGGSMGHIDSCSCAAIEKDDNTIMMVPGSGFHMLHPRGGKTVFPRMPA
ncbi:hypothetical protein PAXRUDRAFT_827108 [Paxillus rubicundulus Ve08.2h10]|uniref:Uncharacterized protein n=1 Tax=Paxillus rubicundulus Ve08.2h10 TaxID=930991 RepID=A0A0D0DDI2_9AGAM|nr:hypothetical protein PAXRUDRAFT_827108 [Paxillus rubicundulus Ve08.2h10]